MNQVTQWHVLYAAIQTQEKLFVCMQHIRSFTSMCNAVLRKVVLQRAMSQHALQPDGMLSCTM